MERDFKYRILDLAENIEKDFKNLKAYCDLYILNNRLEIIKACIDRFHELESKTVVSYNDVEPLPLMIEKCKNNNRKLIEMITRFQTLPGSTADTNVDEDANKNLPATDRTQDFFPELFLLTNELGNDWKFFIRALGVGQSQLEIMVEQNKNNVKEMIYTCLTLWLTRIADQMSDDEIRETWIKKLRSIERNDLVSQLKSLEKNPQ